MLKKFKILLNTSSGKNYNFLIILTIYQIKPILVPLKLPLTWLLQLEFLLLILRLLELTLLEMHLLKLHLLELLLLRVATLPGKLEKYGKTWEFGNLAPKKSRKNLGILGKFELKSGVLNQIILRYLDKIRTWTIFMW